jgi:hypothetical protein
MHSSQFNAFEGFRPTFPHSLGPWTFEFNGLLNVPFHHSWTRTPHFPFPIYLVALLLPVVTWGAAANLLPHRYWRTEPSWAEGAAREWTDLGEREIRVLAVWYYIYGGRRDDVSSP